MGNLIMSDDGVGIHVLRELQKGNLAEDILLLEVGTSPLNYLEEISQSEKVIIIDAMRGGATAGSIYRLTEDNIKFNSNNTRDFHGYTLLNVVELARELTDLPINLIIYGVEPKSLDLGEKLSPDIKKSIPTLINLIIKEAREL
ncbi:hydrogenase maturation protease [Orenia metallireducens]|nr:hydrogenase maturation protease [Orenia metallireducens]